MLTRWLRGMLPPTRLERDLAIQCVLSAFATGAFLTGTAVFFTQLVGLGGMAGFIAMLSVLAVSETAGLSARNVYRLVVFPRLRALRWSGGAFVASCAVLAVTHDTVGRVSIVLIWVGHITITGAELWQSAADWGLTSELSDHRRLGDYQGLWGMGHRLQSILFSALFTFLALEWGTPGWAVIALIAVVAAAVAHPAARAAEQHLARVGAPVGV